MKRILTTALIALAFAALTFSVHAGTNDVTTNYFAGYIYVPNTSADIGDTGLTVATPYLCFPLATLTGMTSNEQADVRAVMYSINLEFYQSYTNKAAAIRSASLPSTGTSFQQSGTNVQEIIVQSLRTIRNLGSSTLP